MVINKLVLFRYKRLFLSNIETIEYTPEHTIQVILGGNGQGKSSLLYMLTPTPPDLKKEFNEGGYKIIDIEHHGRNYLLTSGGELGNKHSFVVDGIELNQGGTKTVQSELVKEHFDITVYTHSIILGTNKFTTMPANERKRMFSDISHIDYTFPIKLYNSLKQRHRDIVGGIKILQENILSYESNVVTAEEVRVYKENLSNLSLYIEHLISLYKHNVDRHISVDEQYKTLESLNKEISKLYSSNSGLQTINLETIKSKISILESEVLFYNEQSNFIKDKLSNIDIKPSKSVYELTKEIDAIETELKNSAIEIDNIKLEQTPFILQVVEENYMDTVAVLNELNDYRDLTMSNEDLVIFKTTIDNNSLTITGKSNKLKLLEQEIAHLDKHNTDEHNISCDKCGNTWKYNYDPKQHKLLIINKKTLEEELNKLVELNTININLYSRYLERKEILQKFNNITLAVPVLRPVWLYLLNGLSTEDKRNSVVIVNKLDGIIVKLKNLIILHTKELFLKELKKDLDNAMAINKIIEDNNLKNIEELEIKLSSYIKLTYSKQNEISEYKKVINQLSTLNKLHYDLRYNLKKLYVAKDVSIDQLRNTYITDLTTKLKQLQVELEQKISINNTYINKVEIGNNEIAMLVEKEKVLKLMVKEISPSEGLIAKSINSFLNNYIRDMNSIISKVWSYDIEILPSTISDGTDLDYKFPVRVDGSEIIEDVGKLSSSMQEIVDLAFKIVYIKYSKISNTPLILDEFARTFDKHHRVKAYDIIESLFSSHFKQIFMVSHFESIYGRFTNSDVSILGDTDMYNDINNINEVIRIKYFKE
jgi:hypothetical protein